jgi:uncharacterized membrane protein
MKRTGWAWLQYAEPARLRAMWVALVALLGTIGVTVSSDLDGTVGAIIGVVAVLLPVLQGEWTRASVYSPETHELAVRMAANGTYPPGDAAGPDVQV